MERKVLDWDKAAQSIKENAPDRVLAGIKEDFFFTADPIYEKGRCLFPVDTCFASVLGTPVVRLYNENSLIKEVPCYITETNESPVQQIVWPKSALQILSGSDTYKICNMCGSFMTHDTATKDLWSCEHCGSYVWDFGKADVPESSMERFYLLDNSVFLHIQLCDSGYDYTLYDVFFNEIDGGQLDNPKLSIDSALDEIIKMHNILPEKIKRLTESEFENLREEGEKLADKNEDTCFIFQLSPTDTSKPYLFSNLKYIQSLGLKAERENYSLIYSHPLSETESLDGIFAKFNLAIPQDFKGHSLSVSDIIVLKKDEKYTAYYVDSIGFVEISYFFFSPELFLTPQKVSTPRGTFRLISSKPEYMRKFGFGMHHLSDNKEFIIMSNGISAYAVRNQER